MHSAEEQRVMAVIAHVGEAVAPIVQHGLEQAYGPTWLERVNAQRTARGYAAGRGLHDPRFVLALVANEPELAQAFDDGQRQAARQLNGMGNALAHNESLRAGDTARAEQLSERLAGQTEPVQAVTGNRPVGGLLKPFPLTSPQAKVPGTPREPQRQIQRLMNEEHIQRLMDDRRHGEALAITDQWIVWQPNNPKLWA